MSLLSKAVVVLRSRLVSIGFNRHYGKKLGVLGIPFEKGQQKKGVSCGPQAIRDTGFIGVLEKLGTVVKDFGDVTYELPEKANDNPIVSNMRNLADVAACHQQTSLKVASILDAGYQCLCLGGDHTTAIGTIDGHLRSVDDIAVLWVDAHADLNTCATTHTGNIHGMPAALLFKELVDHWPFLPGMEWLVPKLSVRNLAYIGLRDVDAYERLIMDKLNIPAYGMAEVERYGIQEVTNMALRRIDPRHNRSLHISFDIDGLDPREAPSTGTPVRGGLTLREGLQIIEDVQRTQRLNCLDIVEVNPAIGNARNAEHTIECASQLILSAFGHTRRGFILKDVCDIPACP